MKKKNKTFNNMNTEKSSETTQPTPEQFGEKIERENQGAEAFDDIEASVEGEENEEEKDIINRQMDELNKLNEQLDSAKAEVEKEKKEYLFLMAEFDNFRKRTVKEKSDIIKNAAESTIKDLLPIVDDFERAIEANRDSEDAAAIKEGTELIFHKLQKFLEKNGVTAIESTGEEFNSDLHEALAMVPGDEANKGKVIDTLTKGYKLGDKVIRHAKVAVGQ